MGVAASYWDTFEGREVDAYDLGEHYADALIEILAKPWTCRRNPGCDCISCPWCSVYVDEPHEHGCAWLIAAKACGIA